MSYYNYDTGQFRGYCVRCGSGGRKSEFVHLLIRNGSYGPTKTMAYLCRDCAASLADQLGVELPALGGDGDG